MNTEKKKRLDLTKFDLLELNTKFRNDFPEKLTLDKHEYKQRGYIVFKEKIHNCVFAVPLKSHMPLYKIPSGATYPYVKYYADVLNDEGQIILYNKLHGKGLDYQSAIILPEETKSEYFTLNKTWMIEDIEYDKLYTKEDFVTNQFKKFVDKYVQGSIKKDSNITGKALYSHSTLPLYKTELNCDC